VVSFGQPCNVDSERIGQGSSVDDAVARAFLLDLVVAADLPLRRMLDDAGAHHVQIDVHQAARQMLAGSTAVAW
jgi:hypothetical protein